MHPNSKMIRSQIAELRLSAARCLASRDMEVRARASGYLRMVEVMKVQLLAAGENVTVVSREGTVWGPKR